MQPLLRPPPAATPTGHPTDPTQPIAHDRPLDPGSAVRQSVPPAGHSALFCPSGVVLLSVVFVDLPWEATPPHFYSVTGTRPAPHSAARASMPRFAIAQQSWRDGAPGSGLSSTGSSQP